MDLEPRLLRYFIAVAGAAFRPRRRLHISSRRSAMPSASWSRAWGAPAGAHQPPGGADRGGQGAVPRGPGAAAAGRGRARAGAARRRRAARAAAHRLRRFDAGLPALLAAMRAELPEVEHVLAELNSHDQIEAVHRGELDLGFIHANPLPEGVQAQDLVAERRLPAVRPCAGAARQPGAGRAGRRGLRVLRASGLAQLLRDGAVAVRDGRLHAAGAARGASLAERGRAGVAGTGVAIVPACLSRSGLAGTRFIGFEHEARSVSQAIWPAGAARRCRKARCGW